MRLVRAVLEAKNLFAAIALERQKIQLITALLAAMSTKIWKLHLQLI
jgi:hypothetical protein